MWSKGEGTARADVIIRGFHDLIMLYIYESHSTLRKYVGGLPHNRSGPQTKIWFKASG